MDTFNDPAVNMVVFVKSSRVGGTEALNNMIGYSMDLAPAPIGLYSPTQRAAELFSQRQIRSLVQDCSTVKEKMLQDKVMFKRFAGGSLTLCYATVADQFRAHTFKSVFLDEVDAMAKDIDGEGDPISLAIQRTRTYGERKFCYINSSPTVVGDSNLEDWWEASDQRFYHVPCHHCGQYQRLVWSGVEWDKDEFGNHLVNTAKYHCSTCGTPWDDWQRTKATQKGKWIPTKPSLIRGYSINQLYANEKWVKLAGLVQQYLMAKKSPSQMKTFVNTVLGEWWKPTNQGRTINAHELQAHVSHYDVVPYEALILTAGVDVQKDRLEVSVKAFSPEREIWCMKHHVIQGDPFSDTPWNELESFLSEPWIHASGKELYIARTFVDSGGHWTRKVYEECYRLNSKGINAFAIKGSPAAEGKRVIDAISNTGELKVPIILVVNQLKSQVHYHLNIPEKGEGYVHFRAGYHDEGYFTQITNEQLRAKIVNGRQELRWMPKHEHARNEALDCFVYALAALDVSEPDWDELRTYLHGE
jgi:phage terminase large subunit GpA-like protein